jgi:hypothetical protein
MGSRTIDWVDGREAWRRSAAGVTTNGAGRSASVPLGARRLRQPQNDVAVGLAGTAHMTEPADKLVVEPDPNQAVGTRSRPRIGHP